MNGNNHEKNLQQENNQRLFITQLKVQSDHLLTQSNLLRKHSRALVEYSGDMRTRSRLLRIRLFDRRTCSIAEAQPEAEMPSLVQVD